MFQQKPSIPTFALGQAEVQTLKLSSQLLPEKEVSAYSFVDIFTRSWLLNGALFFNGKYDQRFTSCLNVLYILFQLAIYLGAETFALLREILLGKNPFASRTIQNGGGKHSYRGRRRSLDN